MLTIRRSDERGYADHGWLQTFHSFSFADYHDPRHMGFGPLRVINEDRIAAGMGFGTHSHRDMEILTYVLDGELAHKDSIGSGTAAVIHPGDVQRMSAGTGVRHSEFNQSKQETHLLQIWIEPNVFSIPPSYEEKRFDTAAKKGRMRLAASPDGADGSVTIHQDALMYVGTFDGSQGAQLALKPNRRAYVHVASGEIEVNGTRLLAGDAAKLEGENNIQLGNGHDSEVLVFDLP
ncbi:MAG: pirin family protein [Burkholderiaceae bacterium]